ncbi:hypothetical protein RAB80_017670 [Fusarium oxysporum f. sp. vasinfectum]|nr:hypothetical protein RAB80_017670 [Fusarium oxysporum f. sp. vasinfectum]
MLLQISPRNCTHLICLCAALLLLITWAYLTALPTYQGLEPQKQHTIIAEDDGANQIVHTLDGPLPAPHPRYFPISPLSTHLDERFAKPTRPTALERQASLIKLLHSFVGTMEDVGDYHVDRPRFSPRLALERADLPMGMGPGRPCASSRAAGADLATGLYVDITAVEEADDAEEEEGLLAAKDGHRYRRRDVLPLRAARLEDVEMLVPHNATVVLENEYDREALARRVFRGFRFHEDLREWEAITSDMTSR